MSRRAPSVGRVLVRHLMVLVPCAVVVLVILTLAGWSPQVAYVLALTGVAAVVSVAVRRVAAMQVEALWPLPFPPEPEAPGIDTRIGSLEVLLRRSAEDESVFERRLQPLLADIAAHRLRRAHGVDLIEQPDVARRLLGDDTFGLLTTAPYEQVDPARIAAAITAIEHLEVVR